jgi:hypothetical protein
MVPVDVVDDDVHAAGHHAAHVGRRPDHLAVGVVARR